MSNFGYGIDRYAAPLGAGSKISTSQDTRNYTLPGAPDPSASRNVRFATQPACTTSPRLIRPCEAGATEVRFGGRPCGCHLYSALVICRPKVVAARVYAETISGNGRPTERVARRPLDAVAADWLDAIAHPIVSEDTWKYDFEFCRKKLIPHFRHMELITEVGVEDYITTRLRSVRRSSVKKELGSLRRFAPSPSAHETAIVQGPYLRSFGKPAYGSRACRV